MMRGKFIKNGYCVQLMGIRVIVTTVLPTVLYFAFFLA